MVARGDYPAAIDVSSGIRELLLLWEQWAVSDEDMQRFLPEGMLWLQKDKAENNERNIQPTCVGYTDHVAVSCQ